MPYGYVATVDLKFVTHSLFNSNQTIKATGVLLIFEIYFAASKLRFDFSHDFSHASYPVVSIKTNRP